MKFQDSEDCTNFALLRSNLPSAAAERCRCGAKTYFDRRPGSRPVSESSPAKFSRIKTETHARQGEGSSVLIMEWQILRNHCFVNFTIACTTNVRYIP